jgi:hypothetical protein
MGRRDWNASDAAAFSPRMFSFAPWYNLAMLAAESQRVIWLRSVKLAAGGEHALEEAQLMISEKAFAAFGAVGRLAMGDSPDLIVSGYRKKVRANARRLSR